MTPPHTRSVPSAPTPLGYVGDAVSIRNDAVALTVTPQMGGRVVSLRDLRRRVEWLQPGTPPPSRATRSWADSGRFGWDECFPNIAEEDLPDAAGGPRLSDHGELWSREWDLLDMRRDRLDMAVRTATYTLTRSIRLDGPRIRLEYRVTADQEMPCGWALHALMPLSVSVRDALPQGAPVTVEYSSLPGIRVGDSLAWGQEVVGGWRLGTRSESPIALKLYSPAEQPAVLRQRTAALRVLVDPAEVPYYGIWLNYGAWPGTSGGDRHVAVEPTTLDTDSLARAVAAGTAPTLQPAATRTWRVVLDTDSQGDA